ncbi:site-2 protease family protein [Gloeobacter morelensis]|uniref:site-2 protease family protein n=1 Tax=Gloeobacter morelensis TaxID=2907343 RepID=UPI001E623485|nr:site-2 protease family protein [Gloeobacter morelensis]
MILSMCLSVLCIVAHEIGHLIAALWLRVPVGSFSIGLGPVIWQSAEPGRTKYTVKALPISGSIIMEGESEGIRWLPVFLAGPLTNLALAVLLMFASAVYSGPGEGVWQRLSKWERLDRTDAFSIAASVSRSYGLLNLLPALGFDGGQCIVLLGRMFVHGRKRRI